MSMEIMEADDFEYNEIKASDLRVSMKGFPNIPAPKRRYRELEISGRDGKYLEEEGYEDILLTLELNFIVNYEKWYEESREIRRWLFGNKNRELRFGKDAGFYYKVKKLEVGEIEHTTERIGNFNAQFTCEPYSYAYEGKREMALSELEWNPYEVCHPLYIISGNGNCSLSVNDKTVRVNVTGRVVIDTERMLTYLEDKTLRNTALTGKYEDLYLKTGENTFSCSPGFSIKAIPNWRCL